MHPECCLGPRIEMMLNSISFLYMSLFNLSHPSHFPHKPPSPPP